MELLEEHNTDPTKLVWDEPQFPANPLPADLWPVAPLSVDDYGDELHFG
jgi:hypothetical protein